MQAVKVGCNLYEDKLPLDPQLINVCEEFDIDSTVAINGGEDYELLFTIAMEDFDKIKETLISPSLDI
jgi:thiamine-monophosphate kinase